MAELPPRTDLSPPDSLVDDIPSLPDTASSDDIDDFEDDFDGLSNDSREFDLARRRRDAAREWDESLQQLELLLSMVIVPYIGKYFGRKCAFWAWTRWMEWQYAVDVVVTNKTSFRAAGILEAASSL